MSNAIVERNNGVLAAPQQKVVHDDGPLAHLFDTARFEQLQRIAKVLAAGSLTPKHLVVPGNPEATIANCFRVANQSIRWGFDPFAVADESYVVSGKLGYQGKLVTAVVNSRAGIEGRLSFAYAGSGDNREVTVSGKFRDELSPRTITLTVAQARTSNDMWKKDPDQKLAYTGATKWARRHCPEVMAGVLTDDDLDSIAERNARQTPQAIAAITSVLTAQRDGDYIRTNDESQEYPSESSDGRVAGDGGDAEPTIPSQAQAGTPAATTQEPLDWERAEADFAAAKTIAKVSDLLEVWVVATTPQEGDMLRGLAEKARARIRDGKK